LLGEFGAADLKFEMSEDEGTTGNFEVTIVETGTLIHSKKGGKGKCESNKERDDVIDAIESFLYPSKKD